MRKQISSLRTPGFLLMHAACLLVIWSGVSWVALYTCLALYLVRMIGITAGYHRYFSHRTYQTSRLFQFLLALLGTSAAQQGPLWWAAHHRYHHKFSDTQNDVHSPSIQGFWWAHVGWILAPENQNTKYDLVPDLIRFPELRFLDKFYLLPPLVLAASLWVSGIVLASYLPALETSGFQLLVWGFFVGTVLLYHSTFSVNSLTHIFGRRRFETKDNSRNCWPVAIITMGEGWHNNHHYYPSSERHGFRWWEIDVSHYVLRLLCWMRIVWDLRSPPKLLVTSQPPDKPILQNLHGSIAANPKRVGGNPMIDYRARIGKMLDTSFTCESIYFGPTIQGLIRFR